MREVAFVFCILGIVALGGSIIYSVYWALWPIPGFVLPLKQAADKAGADYWSLDQVVEDCTTEPAKWMAYVKDKSKQHIIQKYGKTPEEAATLAIEAIDKGEWERLCTRTTLKSYSTMGAN